jgi:hypothetical protein
VCTHVLSLSISRYLHPHLHIGVIVEIVYLLLRRLGIIRHEYESGGALKYVDDSVLAVVYTIVARKLETYDWT